jgi:hypothetical protein
LNSRNVKNRKLWVAYQTVFGKKHGEQGYFVLNDYVEEQDIGAKIGYNVIAFHSRSKLYCFKGVS